MYRQTRVSIKRIRQRPEHVPPLHGFSCRLCKAVRPARKQSIHVLRPMLAPFHNPTPALNQMQLICGWFESIDPQVQKGIFRAVEKDSVCWNLGSRA